MARQRTLYKNVVNSIHYNDSYHDRESIANRAIWRAVIMQALLDATRIVRKPEGRAQKRAAIMWLRGKSKDFFLVCNLAELSSSYVRRCSRKVITRGRTWRMSRVKR